MSAARTLYGVSGVLVLGVLLDSWLLAGAILLAMQVVHGATPLRPQLSAAA